MRKQPLSEEQVDKARRNRELFKRAIVVIMYHTKKTSDEVIAMLQDDTDPCWKEEDQN